MSIKFNKKCILGIDFFNDSLSCALQITHSQGGLILAPSGPGLSELGKNPRYDAALQNADVNLIDSGYLALLWKKRTGETLQRHSGLKFIHALVESDEFKASTKQLWVMPNQVHADSIRTYLSKQGIELSDEQIYIAPFYDSNKVEDSILLNKVTEQKPNYLILTIAGGKQEVLGHWLQQHANCQPSIVCIGAAIAFLSGEQARIPAWADRIFIGWFLRIIADPKTFLPRYWKARKLKSLLQRHGKSAPPISQ